MNIFKLSMRKMKTDAVKLEEYIPLKEVSVARVSIFWKDYKTNNDKLLSSIGKKIYID